MLHGQTCGLGLMVKDTWLILYYAIEKGFIENEGNFCSFVPELFTLKYVYRMWGGSVALEDIANAKSEVRRMM